MIVFYPYNEILPRKRAHDIFLFQECVALASLGAKPTLLIGAGSQSDESLFKYYGTHLPITIKRLPILRKNNPLGLSWNLPFFLTTQREIKKYKPDLLILSVLKQGNFHLKRKIPGVTYLYEVHELKYYPNGHGDKKAALFEKRVLERADIITVTTEALKEILQAPPYSLDNQIEVIALAVNVKPLPSRVMHNGELSLFYVGALYEGQGISLLLDALKMTTGVTLTVIGGKESELADLGKKAQALGIEKKVKWLGFLPPHLIRERVLEADAFVAPFSAKGRMPYVAHTKLCDYCAWGRAVIAPDLAASQEHFQGKGALFFKPDDASSLAQSIEALKENILRERLNEESKARGEAFSWDLRAQKILKIKGKNAIC